MRSAIRIGVRGTALGLLSLVLCSATYVLGAAPLLILRNIYGRLVFLLVTAGLASGLMALDQLAIAALFFSQALLILIYSELEEQGATYAASGLLSVLFVSGFSAVGVAAYVHSAKISFLNMIQDKARELVENITQINPKISITAENIMAQLPSGVVVAFIISLVVAVVLEKLVKYSLFNKTTVRPSYYSLLSFELPDICVWISIVGIAGVGLKLNNPVYKTVGLNILNIMITLYFLQGMAIVYSFFRTFKIGLVWQGIWAFILVFQLFIFVSALGFIDYWLDIRKRIYRRVAPSKLDKRI